MSITHDTVDFVVVGGGSAGCVVASRLTEDPGTSVCLLEAGGDTDDWLVDTPAAFFMMVASPIHNWHFNTVPQRALDGRRGYQPRGKGLGGSSAINAMVYIRGHRSDYDAWASLGNKGWSCEEVLPYFKRAEDNSEFSDEYHGTGGPLGVSKAPSDNPLQAAWLTAAREAGFPLNADFNGATQEGIGLYQATVRNGERSSAARAYIYPILAQRPNLRVVTHAHATQLIFEGKRAVGVEYRQGGEVRRVKARREVIVCVRRVPDTAAAHALGHRCTRHAQQLGDTGGARSRRRSVKTCRTTPTSSSAIRRRTRTLSGSRSGEAARVIPALAEYGATGAACSPRTSPRAAAFSRPRRNWRLRICSCTSASRSSTITDESFAGAPAFPVMCRC